MIGLGGMILGLIMGFFVRSTTPLLIVLAAMGAFWALININSLPMVYDLGDEKQIGSYTGLYYFASSAAAIAGPVVAGVLIDLAGRNYSVLWIFSAIFLAIAAFLMTRIHVKSTVLAIEPLSP